LYAENLIPSVSYLQHSLQIFQNVAGPKKQWLFDKIQNTVKREKVVKNNVFQILESYA
jgi:hypothetical protein